MDIEKYLSISGLHIESYDTLDSTNTLMRKRAREGAPEGTVIIAERQSAGRGRMGRSFFSPHGTGLYMSLLLRPDLSAKESLLITTCAAVSVAESIEQEVGCPAQIKWVNDVFVNGYKVCGILTEAVLEPDNVKLSCAVLGIGINISPPESGFPEELEGVATTLLTDEDTGELRERLAARILERFMNYYARLTEKLFLEGYRARSILDDRQVWIVSHDGAKQAAHVLGIDEDFRLMVKTDDGQTKSLISDEVTLRL